MLVHLRRLGLALALAFSGALLVPSAAYACSCAVADAAQHARHADAVFVGRVDGRDERHPSWPLVSSGDPVTYRISVERVYKGRVGPVARVESAAMGVSCGIEVDVGRDYLLYAERSRSGELWASSCGGTRPADVDALAAAERTIGRAAPSDEGVVPEAQRSSLLWPAGGVALTLAAAVAIGLGVRPRR